MPGIPLSPWRPVQGFARAAEKPAVTPAAVAHRVGVLEKHLDVPLFDRRHRGVRLDRRGRAYLKEVQRILAEVHGVSERQRRWPRRVRIVSVEAVAEKWLVPRLATFKAEHPAGAIELETNHRGVDPDRRDFDAWLAYTGKTAAPDGGCLITTAASRQRPEVQAFREWVLEDARTGADGVARRP